MFRNRTASLVKTIAKNYLKGGVLTRYLLELYSIYHYPKFRAEFSSTELEEGEILEITTSGRDTVQIIFFIKNEKKLDIEGIEEQIAKIFNGLIECPWTGDNVWSYYRADRKIKIQEAREMAHNNLLPYYVCEVDGTVSNVDVENVDGYASIVFDFVVKEKNGKIVNP